MKTAYYSLCNAAAVSDDDNLCQKSQFADHDRVNCVYHAGSSERR